MQTVLFICTGNTCRSPMAEGFFRALDGEKRTGFTAVSAGIFTEDGLPATGHAIAAARERGADISSHCAHALNESILLQARYVFCMTGAQLDTLLGQFPQMRDKAFCLGEQDISDPFGGDIEVYRRAAKEIHCAVSVIIEKLERHED